MLRAGGERICRHDAVDRDSIEMLEDTLLVRRQWHVARRTKSNVEHARATLLDVDDVARGEVDQRGRHRVVGHAEPVDEEVRDGGRLGPEVERPRADRGLWRCA